MPKPSESPLPEIDGRKVRGSDDFDVVPNDHVVSRPRPLHGHGADGTDD